MSSKKQLRALFRNIKKKLLTKENLNSYHTPLANNFKKIISIFQQGLIYQNRRKLVIGSYINKPVTEIIPPLLHKFQDHQFDYAFPYFSSKSRQMAYFSHKSETKYKKGSFGVKVVDLNDDHSVESEICNLDIVLVPLVAYNSKKFRIGQGGGYYDKYIKKVRWENTRKKYKTWFVGVALEQLMIPSQIQFESEWDEKLDYIITEKKIYI